MRIKNFFALFFLALLAALCRTSSATTSLGFDLTGGVGQSGIDTTGTLDVGPERDWETSLSYAHLHTTEGTESKTNQYTIGAAHSWDPAWDSHLNATYWQDTLNDIHYAGPTLGFTYTLKSAGSQESPSKGTESPADALPGDEVSPTLINPITERKKEGAGEASDLLSVSLDTDIFIYGTEVTASSTTRRVFNRRLRRFVQQAVPPNTSKLSTTQFHPNLTIEVPLFDEAFVPSVTVGHYFYSTDPSAIEDLTGRPRLAASAGRVNSLVGGFLNNNGSVGFSSPLPGEILFNGSLGADQSATDRSWATTQSASMSRSFADRLRLKVEWERAIQGGISTDTIIGGMTYKFGAST